MTVPDGATWCTAKMQEEDALFRLQHGFLSRGSATEAAPDGITLLTVDEQARELVQDMAQRVRVNNLTQTMARFLADFLNTLDGPARWQLLGLARSNRRQTEAGQQSSAVYAYTDALERGRTVDQALESAYDAYFRSAPRKGSASSENYDKDSKIPRIKGHYKTLGAQRMATVVRPALVHAGLLRPIKSGRRRKSK